MALQHIYPILKTIEPFKFVQYIRGNNSVDIYDITTDLFLLYTKYRFKSPG